MLIEFLIVLACGFLLGVGASILIFALFFHGDQTL